MISVKITEKLAKPLEGIAKGVTTGIGFFGAGKQLKDDLKGMREDSRIDKFTSGLYRGMFENIGSPEEAVERAAQFVSGVNAFYDNNLEDSGVTFVNWQSALVDVSNGVDNELYNDTMSSLEAPKED